MICKMYVLLKHISIQFMLSIIGSQFLFPLLKMKRFPISESSESEISVMFQLTFVSQLLSIFSEIFWLLFCQAQELIIFFGIDSYLFYYGYDQPNPRHSLWNTNFGDNFQNLLHQHWLYLLQRKIWPIK